MQNRKMDR
jgi:hypothetical protein